MSLGEGSEVRGRLPTRGSSLDGLHRAHAAGQEPHVVREVSRHDSDLALRAEEDDRLLEHLLAGTDHPEGSVPAGAVLPEDAILGAIDPATGLIIAGWNPARGKAVGPPRGCAVMLALPDLFEVSASLAREQWECARRHLVRTVSGLTGVREYPEPIELPPNTDSGRIILGLGEAASGFGLAAAAAAGDADLLAALLRSARRVAPPTWNGDELVLANVPPVGQAALLRAKVWNADAAAVAGRA